MILVDSSVFIDQLNGRTTLQTLAFERLAVTEHSMLVGDLVMVEVLQGVRDERQFEWVAARLSSYRQIAIVDHTVALGAARNYRILRQRGITVRKTIDSLIATRCMIDGLPLLYSDRDFEPFVHHLGLVSALDFEPGDN